jgi:hypothetical protein
LSNAVGRFVWIFEEYRRTHTYHAALHTRR